MSKPWTAEELQAASKAMESMGFMSYEDFCKELAELFGQEQPHHHYLCPRCGEDAMDENPMRNALSRKGNIHICDQCGTDEAVQAYMGTSLPISQWAIITTPEQFHHHPENPSASPSAELQQPFRGVGG